MTQGKQRQGYDKEFKLMVVNQVLNGRSSTQVGEEHGLDSSMIRRWVRQFKKYEDNSFQGNGNIVETEEEKRIRILEQELNRVKMERDILKKAVGIFSKTDS
ncbi:transposase [Halosquirtibacter xylanolyticus]|uniref:transposase n=1 Tax=Halosquirtibacter xylanolyticus TaxID=3374599 RepID=UPI003747D6CC|nr:transposase [Prolixibacteraceae bacterium]